MTDPFADPFASPVDEAQTTNPGSWEETTMTNVVEPGGNKVRVTLKGGTGYDAPWVTIDGVSIQDALDQLTGENATVVAELVKRVAQVGAVFAGTGNSKPAAGNGGGQLGKPAGATQAPSGETAPICHHGPMEWKSWTRASDGKMFKGFFCAERNRDAQCKAEFRK